MEPQTWVRHNGAKEISISSLVAHGKRSAPAGDHAGDAFADRLPSAIQQQATASLDTNHEETSARVQAGSLA